MNRNWRVCTPEGVWALKQVLDVHADQARRQHRVTRTHLFISASALLAWWSEHRDCVSSAFTTA